MNPIAIAAAAGKSAAATVAVPTAAATAAPANLVNQVAPTTAAMPLTAMQQHAPWLTHGIAGIAIISAIALIVLLAVQTTKQEGLSGTLGGRVETAYRGRLGAEDQLKRVTGTVAGIWVVSFLILALTGI